MNRHIRHPNLHAHSSHALELLLLWQLRADHPGLVRPRRFRTDPGYAGALLHLALSSPDAPLRALARTLAQLRGLAAIPSAALESGSRHEIIT